MNRIVLLSLATINLVAGNNLPAAFGLRQKVRSLKISSVRAQTRIQEPNCTTPFTAVGSSCLHFVNELQVDHDESEFVCDAIGGHLAVIDTATKLHDIVDFINSNYNSVARSDSHCANSGYNFLAPNGQPAICPGRCCSDNGWCGGSSDHCDCSGCIDYRDTANSPHQTYWIDGGRDTDNQWSFTNVDSELPMGTPFWGTRKWDGGPEYGWMQRPFESEDSGNCLTLSYDSSYYFTENDCGSNLPSPMCEQTGDADHDGTRGTIVSPNYPNNYPNNANSEWSITTDENATITFNFEAFNTESIYDVLKISDGIDGNAPELLSLSGSQGASSISEVTSTGNALYFRFSSDSSETRSGFKLNWSASSDPEIIDITCPPFYTPVGQDCFAFFFVPMSFNKAKITCASMNSQLGVVSNAEQLRSLYLYINDQDIAETSFWLGGSDRNDEGHFVYEDGTDVPKGTPFWGTTGEQLEVQEPDGGDEDNCMALVADGFHFLRDVQCSTEMEFMCSPL